MVTLMMLAWWLSRQPPPVCRLYCTDGGSCFYTTVCRPRVVNLGEWDAVPNEYSPAPQSDFPIYTLPDPAPAPWNTDFSGPEEK